MTTSTTDAEAIARIIDPDVFCYHKSMIEAGLKDGLSADEARAQADRCTAHTIPPAVVKAERILSYLASRREAQEPVAPFAENGYGSRLLREAVAYLNEYVFDFDSGADHELTEFERFMMEDMLNGLFSHEPFFGIIRNLAAPLAPAGEVERLREALEQVRTVARDNDADGCDHRMALKFIASVTRAALNGGRHD